MKSHQLGKEGEAFALAFLQSRGYKILATNYRTKIGEIDCIADDHGTIVFIEVKTREEDGWDAFEAVTRDKQRKIVRTATEYLVETFGKEDIAARFDVLALYYKEDGSFRPDLLKNAFSAS